MTMPAPAILRWVITPAARQPELVALRRLQQLHPVIYVFRAALTAWPALLEEMRILEPSRICYSMRKGDRTLLSGYDIWTGAFAPLVSQAEADAYKLRADLTGGIEISLLCNGDPSWCTLDWEADGADGADGTEVPDETTGTRPDFVPADRFPDIVPPAVRWPCLLHQQLGIGDSLALDFEPNGHAWWKQATSTQQQRADAVVNSAYVYQRCRAFIDTLSWPSPAPFVGVSAWHFALRPSDGSLILAATPADQVVYPAGTYTFHEAIATHAHRVDAMNYFHDPALCWDRSKHMIWQHQHRLTAPAPLTFGQTFQANAAVPSGNFRRPLSAIAASADDILGRLDASGVGRSGTVFFNHWLAARHRLLPESRRRTAAALSVLTTDTGAWLVSDDGRAIAV